MSGEAQNIGTQGGQQQHGTGGGQAAPANQPEQASAPDLQRRLDESLGALEKARAELSASERRRTIERELAAAGAIDLEAASAVFGARHADIAAPGIAQAVGDLKRAKPFLFRAPPARPSAMSAAADTAPDPAASAREHARATGDRRSLLSYLRLRRTR